MKCIFLVLFISQTVYHIDCRLFVKNPSEWYHETLEEYIAVNGDVGKSLILTPLIEQKKFAEAKTASLVTHKEFFDVVSYSGFFTVDKTFNSNLFFWFFPAEQNYASAPVMLWLQGGPSDSSLTGLFAEHGAFKIIDGKKVELRETRWSKDISMLYIDNPVGTGFSYTNETQGGLCQNQTIIGEHLHEALKQFFQVFSELRRNAFYVAGESYGGKYAPTVAHTIHSKNPTEKIKINLKGLALVSGFSDPEHMLNYSDYLYQVGLIDSKVKKYMEILQTSAVNNIQQKEWDLAADNFAEIIRLYSMSSGMENAYNYLYQEDPVEDLVTFYTGYVQRDEIRKALHVGNATYTAKSDSVYTNLRNDLVRSVAPWISELLDHYRIVTMNGQLDVVVAYPLTENYLQNLDFSAKGEYKLAARNNWYVNGKLAGYSKTAGNLTEVLVRNGGHVLMHDQPEWCYDLIHKFIRNVPIV